MFLLWTGRCLTALRISKEIGFDPEVVLATSHGRRSIDTLQVLDPSKANWECMSMHVDSLQAETHLPRCSQD